MKVFKKVFKKDWYVSMEQQMLLSHIAKGFVYESGNPCPVMQVEGPMLRDWQTIYSLRHRHKRCKGRIGGKLVTNKDWRKSLEVFKNG